MNKIYHVGIVSILLSFSVIFSGQNFDTNRYAEIVSAYQQGMLETIINQYRPKMSEDMEQAWDAEKIQKNESIHRLMDIVESHYRILKERKNVIESSYFFSLFGGITGRKDEAERLQEQMVFDEALLRALSKYLDYYIFY